MAVRFSREEPFGCFENFGGFRAMSFSDLPDHWLYSKFHPEAGVCFFANCESSSGDERAARLLMFFFLTDV